MQQPPSTPAPVAPPTLTATLNPGANPSPNPAAAPAAAAAAYQPNVAPGVSSMAQFDSLPSGKAPPGFDPSTCRSVYVGNIHSKVTESMLYDIFSNLGPLEGCKLIRKEVTSFGFVNYFDPRSAQAAMTTLNGRQLFGQPIKVNWAFQGLQKEDVSGHVSVFVGDLGAEITDAALYAAFSIYGSCSGAKVMWDSKTGRSKGYGFVSFREHADAERALSEMTGKYVGSRAVRCNWATKGPSAALANQQQRQPLHPQLSTAPASDQAQDAAAKADGERSENGTATNGSGTGQAPPAASAQGGGETAPQFTTVYVGNLSPEVTQIELHRQFYALGLGVIEDVKISRDKGFGFVRYSTSDEAAAAISAANGRIICGRPVKCSWGSKPTLPSGKHAQGLPPPPPAASQGGIYGAVPGPYGAGAAADLAAYQQRLRSYMPGAQPSAIPGMGMPGGPMGGMQSMGMGAQYGGPGPQAMGGAAMHMGMHAAMGAGAGAMGGNMMAPGGYGVGGMMGAPGGYDVASAGVAGQSGYPQPPYY